MSVYPNSQGPFVPGTVRIDVAQDVPAGSGVQYLFSSQAKMFLSPGDVLHVFMLTATNGRAIVIYYFNLLIEQ